MNLRAVLSEPDAIVQCTCVDGGELGMHPASRMTWPRPRGC